jgi:hypothetical protein
MMPDAPKANDDAAYDRGGEDDTQHPQRQHGGTGLSPPKMEP